MSLPRNKKLLENARKLRREMTKEENRLWYLYLRECSVKFYKQKIIGNYIVDFYCHKAKLVIELDGSQHYEDHGVAYDSARTAYLESLGLEVMRIPNNEVNRNFDGVCEAIYEKVKEKISPRRELSAELTEK